MTIKQKAKQYDKALEWMEGLYPGLHGKTKKEAETYFPELIKESDERIKEIIINILLDWRNTAIDKKVEQDIKDAIDAINWVKKQKSENTTKYKKSKHNKEKIDENLSNDTELDIEDFILKHDILL